MQTIPVQLADGFSGEGTAAALAWWNDLTNAARSEVATLFDARQEEWFFGLGSDPSAQGPKVLGGRFIPKEDDAGWAEWHAEYFEHLMCHPELGLFEPPVVRTFHICTRHDAARAALAAGRIPADFRCPLRLAECPMRRLLSLAPGRDFQIVPNRRAPLRHDLAVI